MQATNPKWLVNHIANDECLKKNEGAMAAWGFNIPQHLEDFIHTFGTSIFFYIGNRYFFHHTSFPPH
jgi:hypothetical protein